MNSTFFIGIDVGTQGARTVLMDARGTVTASHETDFELSTDSRQEQDPALWWRAVLTGLKALMVTAARKEIPLSSIKAMAVTSTSGTVIPLDKEYKPLHPAIMYSDPRSKEEGILCKEIAMAHHPSGYHGFSASSGLSKMVWFVKQYPEKVSALAHWCHAADYITGQLSGQWGLSDETSVLKSGFDLELGQWPAYITEQLPLEKSWLPRVTASGQPIGHLKDTVGAQIGLPTGAAENITIAAGMTDGCASQVASGAVRPGNWNTTIGTTLVIKGVTKMPIKDPLDRLYNHHHPEGFWMPGGASNTGADWVTAKYADQLQSLEKSAAAILPTSMTLYPLMQSGERFPFIAPAAKGFGWDQSDPVRSFAAAMEGVAYIEKMAFQLISKLSGEQIERVYTAGGASSNKAWLTIRSSVLALPVCKMAEVSGAVGAAILAASKAYYHSLSEAVDHMARVEGTYMPDKNWTHSYQQGYQEFVAALAEKGYINPKDYLLGS